jgi:hypothetical protein
MAWCEGQALMRIKGFGFAKCFLCASLYRNVLCANLTGTLRWTSLYPNVRNHFKKPAGVRATTGMGRQQLEGKCLKTAAALGAVL